MTAVAGVDLGASSGRVVLGILENGEISLQTVRRFKNQMSRADAGHLFWDMDHIIREIRYGIDAAHVIDSISIKSIGIDAFGVDYCLVDHLGVMNCDSICYRDKRNTTGSKSMQYVYSKIPKRELFSKTGIQELPFNTIFQLVDDLKSPSPRSEALREAKRLQFIPEYIAAQLCDGVSSISEVTVCSTSGLLDPHSRNWHYELILELGLPRHIFGEIRESESSDNEIGVYKVKSGSPIPILITPMHDTAAAIVAVPAKPSENWAFISSGSWSLIGTETLEPIITEEAFESNYTNELGVENTVRVLKNINGLFLLQECQKIWNISFEEITKMAENSSFEGQIDPTEERFMGLSDDSDSGNIVAKIKDALELDELSIGDICRCLYTSLAREYGKQFRSLERICGKKFDVLYIVGGGSQIRLLNQLTANECHVKVVAGESESTALGNIMMQLRALGHFDSLADIRACIRKSESISLVEYEYLPL